jgi:hypothetical protein
LPKELQELAQEVKVDYDGLDRKEENKRRHVALISKTLLKNVDFLFFTSFLFL